MPLGLSKKIVKRSLCNSRCAIGIWDAKDFEKGLYCTRCAIGIRCKLLPKINKYLTVRNVAARFGYFSVFCWNAAVPLGLLQNDVTSRRVMWLSSISQFHWVMWLSSAWCDLSPALVGWQKMDSRRPTADGVPRTPAVRKPVEVKVVEIPWFTWVFLYIQRLCFCCPFWILPGLDAETLGGHAEGASEGGWTAEELVGLVGFFWGVKGLFGRGFSPKLGDEKFHHGYEPLKQVLRWLSKMGTHVSLCLRTHDPYFLRPKHPKTLHEFPWPKLGVQMWLIHAFLGCCLRV